MERLEYKDLQILSTSHSSLRFILITSRIHQQWRITLAFYAEQKYVGGRKLWSVMDASDGSTEHVTQELPGMTTELL